MSCAAALNVVAAFVGVVIGLLWNERLDRRAEERERRETDR